METRTLPRATLKLFILDFQISFLFTFFMPNQVLRLLCLLLPSSALRGSLLLLGEAEGDQDREGEGNAENKKKNFITQDKCVVPIRPNALYFFHH